MISPPPPLPLFPNVEPRLLDDILEIGDVLSFRGRREKGEGAGAGEWAFPGPWAFLQDVNVPSGARKEREDG